MGSWDSGSSLTFSILEDGLKCVIPWLGSPTNSSYSNLYILTIFHVRINNTVVIYSLLHSNSIWQHSQSVPLPTTYWEVTKLLKLWRYGNYGLWCYGAMVLWCYGVMMLWRYDDIWGHLIRCPHPVLISLSNQIDVQTAIVSSESIYFLRQSLNQARFYGGGG